MQVHGLNLAKTNSQDLIKNLHYSNFTILNVCIYRDKVDNDANIAQSCYMLLLHNINIMHYPFHTFGWGCNHKI